MVFRTMRTFSVLIVLVVSTGIYAQKGYYNVIGSRIIRPNSEYHATVSLHGIDQPTFITATLEGQSHKGIPLNVQYKDLIQPRSSIICRFEVGDIDDGNYKLNVLGSQELNFIAEFPLQFVNKSYSVFIQTDRAVYAPGSTIMFRSIALNPALKPAAEVRSALLHVHISDGQGNKVKEWRNIEATKGVFSGDLKLSSSPVLGDWNIYVTIHDQTYSKTIKVAEYVLPKFVVDIKAPKHITFKENIINVNIETSYNYGKSISGEATITVYPTIYSGVIQPIFQNPIRKVVNISGSVSVDFDIEKDLGLNDEYERVVIVDVTIEESLTGRRQNNSVEVHIHKYDQKMELVKTADYFKPGLKYVAYVKLTNHDGTPVKSADVTVRHGYSRQDEVYETNTHTTDDKGVIKLIYFTPSEVTNTTALRIEAEYKDLKERISPIPAAVSFSNTFLEVTLQTEDPKTLADIDVVVNCTEPLKYIIYVLLSRGDVLLTHTFNIDNKNVFRFHFTAVHAMVPLSHLIVYYVKDDGELVGDVLDIEVDGLFDNFINIDINADDTEPDLDVELLIRARQNSYVGLIAVDENVLNLGRGFDVSIQDVANELMNYDAAESSPYSLITRNNMKHFTWKPGSNNPHSAIYQAGADIVTNAHINRHRPTLMDIYLRPVFYGSSTAKPDRGVGLPFHTVTRPPLAGPYAFSRIPKPVWNTPKVYLTEDVAPTWLFSNFSSGYEGKTSIRRKVPSTFTNWIISGFSLDPLRGLALMSQPRKLRVAKSFVVSLDLPYSVQQGEILALPVTVVNSNNQDVIVEVTLHNTEQNFEFAEMSNEINATRKIELYRRKKVTVKKNSKSSVAFMITPLKAGSIELKVTANSPRNQDTVIKHLKVEVGGETEYYTKSVLIDLRRSSKIEKSINFTIPKSAIENSIKIEASAVGDLLASSMTHLEHLIRLSTGCGEQNLIHFMPSLIILQYFKNTGQLNPTIQNEAQGLLEQSYQQQLSYRRKDGSFSPFGERDGASNVWLTAYTVLALKQARQFIYVDENIIIKGLDWLAKKQGANGSFVETGTIIHDDMQNKDGNSLALTAFTLLTFMENQKSYNESYANVIYKGLDYITGNSNEDLSTYTLSICTYVLHVARHTSRQSFFNLLDFRSQAQADYKWWSKDPSKTEDKNPWSHLPRSIDIEMTSYALLTFIEADLIDDAMPVLNWLIKQQSNLGGFTSSRDTVTGLQALYRMVLRLVNPTQMEMVYNGGKSRFSINKSNAMIVQTSGIGNNVREVNVSAQGSGIGIFRISYQYNMNVTGPWPLFTLDPQLNKNSNIHHLKLSICAAFVSRNLSRTSISNMAVMEVTLPSGFTTNRDWLPSLEVSQNVQKVDTTHGGTKVILYFNNLTVSEYCPTIAAYRTHKVAKHRPVPVVIYDYYDTSRRARIFYYGRRATLCDICDDDCGNICSTYDRQTGTGPTNKDGSGNEIGGTTRVHNKLWLIIIPLFAIIGIR